MSGQDLDPVEWELVRADIAMEKARLKANGDWSKWEAFQAQANDRFGARVRSAVGMPRGAGREDPETEARSALRRPLRTPDLSFLVAPFRKLRRRGRPLG
ncbi:hypothetical protein DFR50_13451 [Roseiarcus fermentans]|uniref:Uncharacterized protein n=1 Tax=Roseiarcus fermentans TaxID=1473586 RepID=A0A366ETG8_9HYPH|nr:hypothetical protein [Roseiarcus fermentans]RBP05688.1 hypothetical protein DFR50_13451 [Roseiarcus fermentans]